MRQAGFTLLEMLMVVLLIAILAAIGVTAFVNYTTETRNAATKANLQILRNGLGAALAKSELDCGNTQEYWPCALAVNANDNATSIVGDTCPAAAAGLTRICTVAQIPSSLDRAIVGGGVGGIPVNPWGLSAPGVGNKVYDCTVHGAGGNTPITGATGACLVSNHLNCATGAAYVHKPANDDGWCYDPTVGLVWANSENNGGAVGPPSTYEDAY